MKIDKYALSLKIESYIDEKQKQLTDAKSQQKADAKAKALWLATVRAWAVTELNNAKKGAPDKIEVVISSDYWGSPTRKLVITVHNVTVPAGHESEPETTAKVSCDQLEREINSARQHLKLIQMAAGNTVDVSTKSVLESIKPYLS